VQLEQERKRIHDTIKMAAYRAETELAALAARLEIALARDLPCDPAQPYGGRSVFRFVERRPLFAAGRTLRVGVVGPI
jgi:hypothetical protein